MDFHITLHFTEVS